RRPRYPHEPGQQRPVPRRRRRLAGRRPADPPTHPVPVDRDLPRLPEPVLAHRRQHRTHPARRPSAPRPRHRGNPDPRRAGQPRAGRPRHPKPVLPPTPPPAPAAPPGWHTTARHRRNCPLPAGPLSAGTTLTVPMTNGLHLGNHGGTITLLDNTGAKVTSVT